MIDTAVFVLAVWLVFFVARVVLTPHRRRRLPVFCCTVNTTRCLFVMMFAPGWPMQATLLRDQR